MCNLTVAPLERVHQSTRALAFYAGMCVYKQRDDALCQAMQHIWIHLNTVPTRLHSDLSRFIWSASKCVHIHDI